MWFLEAQTFSVGHSQLIKFFQYFPNALMCYSLSTFVDIIISRPFFVVR